MAENIKHITRRSFLKVSGAAATSGLFVPSCTITQRAVTKTLHVWSCGGLAEAFIPADHEFKRKTGISISYTGAFAAALGKSLLGNARTEIFAPRVVKLSKKLKDEGKMLWYEPLCFTHYVLAVPKGNPAGISSIEDMATPGVRVVFSFGASPPGGKATMELMKRAGVLEGAQKNAVFNGDCVQRTTKLLANGNADVGIVEQRIICLPEFRGKLDVISIDEKNFPPPPLTFTIGMMKWAKDPEVAKNYIDFMLSPEGQKHFENAGFIPAVSEEGKRLIKKHGV